MKNAMRYDDHNHPYPVGSVAVIFCAQRNGADIAGYDKAAQQMENLAKAQKGYLDMTHARRPDGFGITISYWCDEAAAIGWRDNEDHKIMRDQGRSTWYDSYIITIAKVTRGYSWP
ncbi:antibiotic biosynthesis monooxygenase family protein [Parasphingorhabdus sp. DH2-15]|uniref:antibiotic biosynthesis monooxygenase family protein n=1 Tax=Parasphingorhabdus sp. DH2-15 TaxID=3444112 RepID=UPI003F68794F